MPGISMNHEQVSRVLPSSVLNLSVSGHTIELPRRTIAAERQRKMRTDLIIETMASFTEREVHLPSLDLRLSL